jgi:hypothetical protein
MRAYIRCHVEPNTQITQFLIHLNSIHFTAQMLYTLPAGSLIYCKKIHFSLTFIQVLKHRNVSSKIVHFCRDILVLHASKGIKVHMCVGGWVQSNELRFS